MSIFTDFGKNGQIRHNILSKQTAVTTTITIAEVFVRVEEKEDHLTMSAYERFFKTISNLEILPVDWHIARLAAKIRGSYPSLRLPDALQLSAPLLSRYPLFVTNDKKIKAVKEIDVVLLNEFL